MVCIWSSSHVKQKGKCKSWVRIHHQFKIETGTISFLCKLVFCKYVFSFYLTFSQCWFASKKKKERKKPSSQRNNKQDKVGKFLTWPLGSSHRPSLMCLACSVRAQVPAFIISVFESCPIPDAFSLEKVVRALGNIENDGLYMRKCSAPRLADVYQ